MSIEDSNNFSDTIIPTSEIMLYNSLYEGLGIPDKWIENCVKVDAAETTKEYLRRNFPRANYMRRAIKRMVSSIPDVKIIYAPKDDEANEVEPVDPKLPTPDPANPPITPKPKKVNPQVQEVQDLIDEMISRKNWEGDMDFCAAVPFWREMAFVNGDLFIKLPTQGDKEADPGAVITERMPSYYTRLNTSEVRRKQITGYRFQYPIGNTAFQDDPQGQRVRLEIITQDKWLVQDGTNNSQGEFIPEGAPVLNQALSYGFIPVAHFCWEPRESSARGLPFMKALWQKALHIYSTTMTRRLGNKFNATPIIVRLNATGELPTLEPGEVVDLFDVSPVAKADMKAISGTLNDRSIRDEYLDALKEFNAEALLPSEDKDDLGSSGAQSGKALAHLGKAMVAYREMFTTNEGSFYVRLIWMMLKIEGVEVELEDLSAHYGEIQEPDDTVKLQKADLLFSQGFIEEALRTLDYDDEMVDALMAQMQAQKTKDAQAFMAGTPKLDENGNPVPFAPEKVPAAKAPAVPAPAGS